MNTSTIGDDAVQKLVDVIGVIAPEEFSFDSLLAIIIKRMSSFKKEQEEWKYKVAGAYGDFWFLDENNQQMFVQIRGGRVELYRHYSNFDKPMKQVSEEEFKLIEAPVYDGRKKKGRWLW